MPASFRTLAASAVAVAALCALPAAAALYKWTDANGRVVYSDQPPTAANVRTETLGSTPPPSNPNAARELAQKEVEIRKRATDRTESAAKVEKDRVAKEQRTEECTRVAGQMKQLSWGQVVIYRANEKGEQIPMDEAARQKERVRLETWQKDNCA